MELIFELLSEEMPPKQQKAASKSLENTWRSAMSTIWPDEDWAKTEITSYYSARRLVLIAKNMPSSEKILSMRAKGPKASATEDAISGFMRKHEIQKKADLSIKDGVYYYVKPQERIEDTISKALYKAVTNIRWQKMMRYGDESFDWIRPIRSALALLDGEVLNISFGEVNASNFTFGHRFLSNDKVEIKSASEYINFMKTNNVIIDAAERSEIIISGANSLAKSVDGQIVDDEDLLEEITGLIELPVPLLCKINEEFMSLPREVIISSLRFHQKYLMIQTPEGELLPYFVVIANIQGDQSKIIEGNEKVLKARLEDAVFSIKRDLKKSPEDRIADLKRLTFHREIGSVYDKITALDKIVQTICRYLNNVSEDDIKLAQRAAYLCKSDLVSETVSEFPELQGIIGYYHAIHFKEREEVAKAIRDHYKPEGPSDQIPSDMVTVILSIADKLYNIRELFKIGIKPTSSKDPYAIRRAALGIIRLICKNNIVINLGDSDLCLSKEVLNFIDERAKHLNEKSLDISYITKSLLLR